MMAHSTAYKMRKNLCLEKKIWLSDVECATRPQPPHCMLAFALRNAIEDGKSKTSRDQLRASTTFEFMFRSQKHQGFSAHRFSFPQQLRCNSNLRDNLINLIVKGENG
jgi:hypothetical protein